MLAVSLGTTVVAIDISLPSIALPSVAKALSVAPSSAVQLVTISQLMLVMTLLPVSALGERLGYRSIFWAGLACFCVGGLLCFAAPTFPTLIAARGLQALGASATISVSTAMIRGIFPDSHLGQGLAVHSVVVSTANAIAPAIGGAILSWLDWKYIFIAGVPLALLSLVISPQLPVPVRRHLPYDWTSAILCAVAFGCITGGLEILVHQGVTAVGAGLIAVSVIVGTLFVRRELSQSDPILPLDLIRQKIIALSVIGSFLAFNASMLMLVTTPFRLSHYYGFSAGEIGALIAPWPLMIMISAPVAAILADRMPTAALGGLGMIASFCGMISLFFLPAEPAWFDIAWRMGLAGVGFGFYTSPNARLILKSAPRERTASAGGLISTNRLTGQVFGASFAAGLLALGPTGMNGAPVVAALLCLIAALLSLARLKP